MRDPMRWMTITALLAGGVFPIGASPRSLVGAEDVLEHVAEAGTDAPVGNGGERSGAGETGERHPDVRPSAHEARPRATTLRVAPEGQLLRGTAGPIHRGKRRIPYETAMEEAGRDPRLMAYRERRRESEPTVASQWALAEWCRRQRLSDQERAHLTVLIALDPSHRSARRRLGQVQVDGTWIDAGDVVSQREAARQSAVALRRHSVTLASLAKRIGDGDTTPEAAVERVRELGSQVGIGALESTLSTANEPAARSVVRMLADDPSDEASASLVSHALSSRWPGVQRAAAAALADRDRGSYVPLLISAFRAPWISRIEWQRRGDGTLFARHVGFSDGAEDRRMTILDHLVMTDMGNERAWAEGTRHVAEQVLSEEGRRGIENERVAMSNQAIAALLRATTGESMSDEPEAWRRWWSAETATYEVGEKPLRVS